MNPLHRWLNRDRSSPAASQRWVVIDTETTGLDPEHDRLIAIGGVAVDGEGVLPGDSFEVVLRHDPARDAAASESNILLHGIGRGAQRTGVPPGQALTAFRDWAGDAPRVGFHADFDRVVLAQAFAAQRLADRGARWLDLAPLAGALVPQAYRYGGRSLDDWLAAFGIECTVRHNAAADAFATAELLLRLRALASLQGARGFDALRKAARHQKWLGTAD
jgi:DNA polymerase III subunit epsilon